MVLHYTKEKELVEEYRLDRLKFDLLESQFVNQKEGLEALRGFLKLYLKNGFAPVINVFGQYGIGKTWLLKYFLEKSIKDAGINFIALDAEGTKSSYELILSIAKLAKIKFNLKLRNTELVLSKLYRRIMDIVELKDGALLKPERFEFKTHITLSKAIGNLRSIYGTDIEFEEKVELDSLEIRDLLKLLPLSLSEDLLSEMDKRLNVVMIIDSLPSDLMHYELIPLLIASLSKKFFIIISSNEKLDWSNYAKNWISPQNMLHVQLQPFQSNDIDKYIGARLGIATEEFVENIVKLTRGKPLYLALLTDYLDHLSRSGVDVIDYAEKLSNDSQDLIEEQLIKGYLSSINEKDRQVFRTISIMDWFDPRDLAIFYEEKTEDFVDNIVSHFIIKPKLEIYDVWRIHEAVRKSMKDINLDSDADKIKLLAGKLIDRFQKLNDIHSLLQSLNLMELISKEKVLRIVDQTINNLYANVQIENSILFLNWMLRKLSSLKELSKYYAKLLETLGLDDSAADIYRKIVDDPTSTDLEKINARTNLAKISFAKGLFSDALSILKVNLEKIDALPLTQVTLGERMRCYYLLSKTFYMDGREKDALRYIELLRSNYSELTSIDKSIIDEPLGKELQKMYINSLYLTAIIFYEKKVEEAIKSLKLVINEAKEYLRYKTWDNIIARTYSRAINLIANYLAENDSLSSEIEWLSNDLSFLEKIIEEKSADKIDTVFLRKILETYEIIGDYYFNHDALDDSYYYYNKIYNIMNLVTLDQSNFDLIIFKAKITPKLARILLRRDKRSAADLLIEARDNIEELIKGEIINREIWLTYFNILKILGKVYNRLNNYERSIEILKKAIGVANSIIAQYGMESISLKDYLDTFKDLFRADVETRQFRSALDVLIQIREFFEEIIVKKGYWKNPELISIIVKITRILKQHLNAPEEFLEDATLIIKDILLMIYDSIITQQETPEGVIDYCGSLSWITITLAKMWYTLSMFNHLYSLLEKAIDAFQTLEEIVNPEEQPLIKVHEFNLRLRRAIARFFSELGIEQVKEDMDACRNILAEIEGKYDPVELSYMKCSLILFDSRIKNSLKQFDQSITNIRDFISIISTISPKRINPIRLKELFDRAYKALKDIKILTRGKLDNNLRENILEIERELRSLRNKLLGK